MSPTLKDILEGLILLLYVTPGYGCMTYYSILKLEEVLEFREHYSKIRFSYFQILGLCIVPFFNIYMFIRVLKMTTIGFLYAMKNRGD